MTILEDFQLGCDPGVYIDQHLKLLYNMFNVDIRARKST